MRRSQGENDMELMMELRWSGEKRDEIHHTVLLRRSDKEKGDNADDGDDDYINDDDDIFYDFDFDDDGDCNDDGRKDCNENVVLPFALTRLLKFSLDLDLPFPVFLPQYLMYLLL